MPKAKPVSLHPLSFEEAVKALVRTASNSVQKKRATSKQKKRKTPSAR